MIWANFSQSYHTSLHTLNSLLKTFNDFCLWLKLSRSQIKHQKRTHPRIERYNWIRRLSHSNHKPDDARRYLSRSTRRSASETRRQASHRQRWDHDDDITTSRHVSGRITQHHRQKKPGCNTTANYYTHRKNS